MKKILSVLMALGMTFSLAACAGSTSSSSEAASESESASAAESEAVSSEAATSEAAAAGTVMSYDEYMAADLDTEVTIEAYVQAKQSWYADQATATVYLQDQDGAYFAYDMACSEEDYDKLTQGTCIRVTGYKSEWSGEVEIIDATFTFVDGADTFVAEPLDVTELLGTDELIDHQNELVTFKGLTVEPSTDANGNEAAFLYNYDGSGEDGDDLYFNVSYNGETYTFTVESYLCDNTTDVYSAVKNLQVGQTIDAEGFLYWYEGVNPHITSVTVTG
ncbi:hypothetical protein [Subdoligranulum variabile]|uniref:Nucleic acid-binding domain protein n=1 Tax=Subdoligranulum variabile DSM 15176 TaxID=411471 RepID=D1PIQ7_9FIRM|nr:hypothetical protein [Subdoligranulum variabile]EFB77416.1 nucleic acid-binding domain protein [Subdoligranulum variabile DSM 15176]UWP67305.1 hypothetical protein NQ490_10165 [Subdoligranulum variabile]